MTTNVLRRSSAIGITVKIVAMGRGVTNYVAAERVTLASVLEELRLGAEGDVLVNGAPVGRDYALRDRDEVLVVPRIRGGA